MRYALKNAILLDGTDNMGPRQGMSVPVENAKTENRLMSNIVMRTVVYDLCSKFARTELMSGVTTIRTAGGLRNIDSRIRDGIDRGRVVNDLPRVKKLDYVEAELDKMYE